MVESLADALAAAGSRCRADPDSEHHAGVLVAPDGAPGPASGHIDHAEVDRLGLARMQPLVPALPSGLTSCAMLPCFLWSLSVALKEFTGHAKATTERIASRVVRLRRAARLGIRSLREHSRAQHPP